MKILFVCLGNICRSPALEATLSYFAEKKGKRSHFTIDSCATTGWYIGEQADVRTQEAAKKEGIQIDHIARLVHPSDFEEFDLILAVNREVLEQLKQAAPKEAWPKIRLACDYSLQFQGQDIPDPFYGDREAFDLVMEMAKDVAQGLLRQFF